MMLEEQLEKFANLCSQTTGASFCITRLKDSGNWQITFISRGKAFSHASLPVVVYNAQEYLVNSRKKIGAPDIYTLYK